MGGHCVNVCPFGYYEYDNLFCVSNATCVEQLGLKLVTVNGTRLCAPDCPIGYQHHQHPSRCVNCSEYPGLCEKRCPGRVLSSLAALQSFRGCTHVDGFLMLSLSHTYNITVQLEAALSMLSYVRDFLAVFSTPALTSLKVFTRLEIIAGEKLYRGKYALLVYDNDALEDLWPAGRDINISRGSVLLYRNPRLCPSSVYALTNRTRASSALPADVLEDLNGYARICSSSIVELQVTPLEGGEVNISWKFDPNSPVKGFFLHLRTIPENSDCQVVMPASSWRSLYLSRTAGVVSGHRMHYTVAAGLKPYARYAFYVQTFSTTAASLQSRVVCNQSLAAAPSAVTGIRLAGREASSLLVVWQPPSLTNGRLDFYQLSYQQIQHFPVHTYEHFCDEPKDRNDFVDETSEPDDEDVDSFGNLKSVYETNDNVDVNTERTVTTFNESSVLPNEFAANLNNVQNDFHRTEKLTGNPALKTEILSSTKPTHEQSAHRPVEQNMGTIEQNMGTIEPDYGAEEVQGLGSRYDAPPRFSVAATVAEVYNYLYRPGYQADAAKTTACFLASSSLSSSTDVRVRRNINEAPLTSPVSGGTLHTLVSMTNIDGAANKERIKSEPSLQADRPKINDVHFEAKVHDDSIEKMTSRQTTLFSLSRSLLVPGLLPFTPYVIQVRACNFLHGNCTIEALRASGRLDGALDLDSAAAAARCLYRCSLAPATRIFYTRARDGADVVRDVKVEVEDGKLQVSWTAPAAANGAVLGYTVLLRRDDLNTHRWCVRPEDTSLVASVHLSAGRHQLQVTTHTPAAASTSAVTVSFLVNETPRPHGLLATALITAAVAGAVIVAVLLVCLFLRCRQRKNTKLKKLSARSDVLRTVYSSCSSPTWLQGIDPVFIHDARHLRLEDTHIGRGNFGVVSRGELELPCGAVVNVATKQLRNASLDDPAILREAKIMLSLRCSHVVRAYGVVVRRSSLLLVLELMERGNLQDFLLSLVALNGDVLSRLSYEKVVSIAMQVADGMLYLRHNKIVHRDLAARNCLIDHNHCVKISDFGLSRPLAAGGSEYYQVLDGTRRIPVRSMPPEFFQSGKYGYESDVWSYGVLLWEVLTAGNIPYKHLKDTQIKPHIIGGQTLLETVPPSCPPPMVGLLRSCWRFSPDERPNFSAIVAFLVQQMDGAEQAFLKEFKRKSFYHEQEIDVPSPSKGCCTSIPKAPRKPLPPLPLAPRATTVFLRRHHDIVTDGEVVLDHEPRTRPTELSLVGPVHNETYGCNAWPTSDMLQSPASTVSTLLSPDDPAPTNEIRGREPGGSSFDKIIESVKPAHKSFKATYLNICRILYGGNERNRNPSLVDNTDTILPELESCVVETCNPPDGSTTPNDDQNCEYEDMRRSQYNPDQLMQASKPEQHQPLVTTSIEDLALKIRLHISEPNLCDKDELNAHAMKHATLDPSFLPDTSLMNTRLSGIRRNGPDSLSTSNDEARVAQSTTDDPGCSVNSRIQNHSSMIRPTSVPGSLNKSSSMPEYFPVGSVSASQINEYKQSLRNQYPKILPWEANEMPDHETDDTLDVKDLNLTACSDYTYREKEFNAQEASDGPDINIAGLETPPPSRNNSTGSSQTSTSHTFFPPQQTLNANCLPLLEKYSCNIAAPET
ncbi:insulin receptor-related protein [Hyalella azteca]|uniref:receptor protein-tyrosine kinase n=1 Tax=Hyalella azteca TaxID=294128 RepID=A0A979FML8_HYAAZ|nr:insulin receptor-related protein [Hyalella azteca]